MHLRLASESFFRFFILLYAPETSKWILSSVALSFSMHLRLASESWLPFPYPFPLETSKWILFPFFILLYAPETSKWILAFAFLSLPTWDHFLILLCNECLRPTFESWFSFYTLQNSTVSSSVSPPPISLVILSWIISSLFPLLWLLLPCGCLFPRWSLDLSSPQEFFFTSSWVTSRVTF